MKYGRPGWSQNKEHLQHGVVSSDHMPDIGTEGSVNIITISFKVSCNETTLALCAFINSRMLLSTLARSYQLSYALINSHAFLQLLSTLINSCTLLSTIIRYHQLSCTPLNTHPLSSTPMRFPQLSCALINSCTLLSTLISSHALSSTLARSCQLSYAIVSSHELT